MKIPRVLPCHNYHVTVEYDEDMETNGQHGAYDSATRTIKINPKGTMEVQRSTVVHEWYHAFLDSIRDPDSDATQEQECRAFELALQQICTGWGIDMKKYYTKPDDELTYII